MVGSEGNRGIEGDPAGTGSGTRPVGDDSYLTLRWTDDVQEVLDDMAREEGVETPEGPEAINTFFSEAGLPMTCDFIKAWTRANYLCAYYDALHDELPQRLGLPAGYVQFPSLTKTTARSTSGVAPRYLLFQSRT